MNKSEQINELAQALSKAQAEFSPAKMDNLNPFFKSRYADLGSVIDAAKEPCAKNGLAVAQPVSCDGEKITVNTILMHSSGQWISSDFTMTIGETRGSSPAQAAGSLITYMRRYALASVLGLYADQDTDGNDSKPAARPAQAAPPAPANGNGKPVSKVAAENVETARILLVPAGSKKGAKLDELTTDELERLLTWFKTQQVKRTLTDEEMAVGIGCQLLIDHRNGVKA